MAMFPCVPPLDRFVYVYEFLLRILGQKSKKFGLKNFVHIFFKIFTSQI